MQVKEYNTSKNGLIYSQLEFNANCSIMPYNFLSLAFTADSYPGTTRQNETNNSGLCFALSTVKRIWGPEAYEFIV